MFLGRENYSTSYSKKGYRPSYICQNAQHRINPNVKQGLELILTYQSWLININKCAIPTQD